eukprot:symbB.v1.2.011970.t1/scaffold788.1/size164690/7
MVYELTRLTVYMQSLRNIQQQLVRSFGEETACNSGIIVKCQPRGLDVSTNPRGKTGLPSMDAALALAAKLQLGDRPSPALTAESTEALVRNALMAGRISSALNLFHELKDSDGATGDVFEEFRVTAGRLAYQLVCNQQLDFLFVAMHMLRNVGESVNRFFKVRDGLALLFFLKPENTFCLFERCELCMEKKDPIGFADLQPFSLKLPGCELSRRVARHAGHTSVACCSSGSTCRPSNTTRSETSGRCLRRSIDDNAIHPDESAKADGPFATASASIHPKSESSLQQLVPLPKVQYQVEVSMFFSVLSEAGVGVLFADFSIIRALTSGKIGEKGMMKNLE